MLDIKAKIEELVKKIQSDEQLKEQPGYPLFLPRAEHEDYEPSPLIRRHPDSEVMDSIGGAETGGAADQQKLPDALTAPVGLVTESMEETALTARVRTDSAMAKPKDIALETMRDADAAKHAPGEPALMSPEGILSDTI